MVKLADRSRRPHRPALRPAAISHRPATLPRRLVPGASDTPPPPHPRPLLPSFTTQRREGPTAADTRPSRTPLSPQRPEPSPQAPRRAPQRAEGGAAAAPRRWRHHPGGGRGSRGRARAGRWRRVAPRAFGNVKPDRKAKGGRESRAGSGLKEVLRARGALEMDL